MRLTIAAIGRLKDGAERTLVDRYVERLKSGKSIGLGPVREIEFTESRLPGAAERKSDEAERLLRAVSAADVRVALDETGRQISSEAFARWISQRRDAGAREAAFIIGGPDGQGPAILSAAQLVLSLGAMTLPHGLARAVLAEQLYRAVTILSGHPYHRV
ncbi:MAG TPA: 23S rRNA (pseudouridine(1915)-N(3))-methyltransferase RlmH [Hyphomicrobiaceae bacterium]|nr:23S rRNA (pseudouridine(1915)-N(3))-methyltransferase RlmH [Hyphomicrobiaceae bacterium]